MPHEVFISYARIDGTDVAARLDKALRERGYTTWRDVRSIDPFKDFSAEIEVGIRDAKFVVVCVTPSLDTNPDSFVRREVLYALQRRKPIIPLIFPNSYVPTLVNHLIWVPFYSGEMPNQTLAFRRGLTQLLTRLEKEPEPSAAYASADPYYSYLTELYTQIVSYLDRTAISFIPLQAEEKPGAVVQPRTLRPRALPMAFWKVLDEKPARDASEIGTKYYRFEDAFTHFGGRALLLGDPGSGKTTTLFAYAREAAARRLEAPSEPLPFVMPVATWDAKASPTLESWLAANITALDQDQIERVVMNGEALLLLDGLDELGSGRSDPERNTTYDPRVEFMKQIPANNQVLVTCRAKEYAEIGEKLRLNGAVRLLPLQDDQVREYLREQPDLWEAICKDEALREMTRTPLLLSLFMFAYAGLGEDTARLRDLSESPSKLRAAVICSYITRRYDHEARKLRIQRPTGQVPFSLESVYNVLGRITMDSWDWSFGYPNFEKQVGKKDARRFVDFVIDLNLMLPVDAERFLFIHLLVCPADRIRVVPLPHVVRRDAAAEAAAGVSGPGGRPASGSCPVVRAERPAHQRGAARRQGRRLAARRQRGHRSTGDRPDHRAAGRPAPGRGVHRHAARPGLDRPAAAPGLGCDCALRWPA